MLRSKEHVHRLAVDAEDLKDWAVNALKVPGLSTQVDLGFICRGEMCKVWAYLVSNVTDSTTAKSIHGNLKLQRRTSSASSESGLYRICY